MSIHHIVHVVSDDTTDTQGKWRFWHSSDKGKENGQNKPPKLNYPHFARIVKLGRLILSVLFPLVTAVSRSATSLTCARKNNGNNIAIKLRDIAAQRSSYQFVSIIYKGVPEIFPIEEISAQVYTPRWQPQVIRRMFCKLFTDQYRGRKTETYPNR